MRNSFNYIIMIIILFLNINLFAEWRLDKSIKVAILEFENSIVEEEGVKKIITDIFQSEKIDMKMLTELFQAELVNKKYFIVIERRELSKILEEQKLQFSGLTDDDKVAKIGMILGAHKVITGRLSKIGDNYYLLIKGIDASTGQIDASETINAKSISILIDNFPNLVNSFILKVSEADNNNIPNINKLEKLINDRAFYDNTKIIEFKTLANEISYYNRIELFKKHEKNPWIGFLLNAIPGIGSLIIGDYGGTVICVLGDLLFFLFMPNEHGPLSLLIFLSTYTYAFISPFTFSYDFNNRLQNALLLKEKVANNIDKKIINNNLEIPLVLFTYRF